MTWTVAAPEPVDGPLSGPDRPILQAFLSHQFSLRMIYVHLIGEYGRHNGHADLLREAIDGAAGR